MGTTQHTTMTAVFLTAEAAQAFAGEVRRYAEALDTTHTEAGKVYGGDGRFVDLVVGPVETVANRQHTVVLLPDGSNRGWDIGDAGDRLADYFAVLASSHRATAAYGTSAGDQGHLSCTADGNYQPGPWVIVDGLADRETRLAYLLTRFVLSSEAYVEVCGDSVVLDGRVDVDDARTREAVQHLLALGAHERRRQDAERTIAALETDAGVDRG